jgi:hypothetical protein
VPQHLLERRLEGGSDQFGRTAPVSELSERPRAATSRRRWGIVCESCTVTRKRTNPSPQALVHGGMVAVAPPPEGLYHRSA